MALDFVPMTELEAVNLMLQGIGEQPVTVLDGSYSEASIAQTLLHQVSREVQSVGLNCNSEERYPLTPDVNGQIALPANTLKVDGYYRYNDVVVRGSKLYDRENHTFTFTANPFYVNIVWFLSFTDLPQCVRQYITIKAARKFQKQLIGSDTLTALSEQDEKDAWLEIVREEVDSIDGNIFDSYDMKKIINRRI